MKRLLRGGSGLLVVLVAAALLLFGASCSHERTDAQIIGDVVTRIHARPQVTNKNIAVMSNKGVVTLNGSVANETERATVANTAAQIEGVKTVVNDLTVAAPAKRVLPETQQASVTESKPVEAAPVEEHQRNPSAHRERRAREPQPKVLASNSNDKLATSAISTSTPSTVSATPNPLPVVGSPNTPMSTIIPSAPAPTPLQLITVESGTPLSVRLVDSIDSERNHPGDMFHGTLDWPVHVGDQVVIPEGASVVGKITEVQDSGRFTGRPQLTLELTSLQVNNRRYIIHTNQYTKQGGSQGARTAKTVGGGAAIGALIGAIAGGGKGAAIGAAVGGGAGGGVQAVRKPQQVQLGSEARLNFRLESPISVAPVGSVDRGYSNNAHANDSQSNDEQMSQAPTKVYDEDQSDPDRPVLKRRTPPPTIQPN